ncbi:MAG: hypothetical protein RLN81_00740 [Balneolaceae bacterium]
MSRLSIHILFFMCILFLGCTSYNSRPYFFLDGYDELEFRDTKNNGVSTREFIIYDQRNSVTTYQVLDTSLTLVYRKTGELYSGFIRTYHWDIYNIEGIFKNGKIERLRYWHSNRRLGMDADFKSGTGQVWNFLGDLAITWNPEEEIFLNPSTQKIRRIQNDTTTTNFNSEGVLINYSIRSDSNFARYYPDGSLSFLFPINSTGRVHGPVKRWHPNGQLRAIGEYRNGREFGTWIEYDSLGNEIDRKDW